MRAPGRRLSGRALGEPAARRGSLAATAGPGRSDTAARVRRADRIRDLPIEQPARFETAINLKTAKLPGVKHRPLVLVRADRVIAGKVGR
jgi:hypothetical protein